VSKAHTLRCAAYNLGLLLRKAFGYCKPRNAQAAGTALFLAISAIWVMTFTVTGLKTIVALTVLLGIAGFIVLFSLIVPTAYSLQTNRKTVAF
jgi:hypothetical protein